MSKHVEAQHYNVTDYSSSRGYFGSNLLKLDAMRHPKALRQEDCPYFRWLIGRREGDGEQAFKLVEAAVVTHPVAESLIALHAGSSFFSVGSACYISSRNQKKAISTYWTFAIQNGKKRRQAQDCDEKMWRYVRRALDTTCNVIPLDASPALWPNLWSCLSFFHTYWDYLPTAIHKDQACTCIMHSAIILNLARDDKTSDIIRSTPGVRRILAMAWKAILYDDSIFGGSVNLAITALSIIADRTGNDAYFEEILEGVGGSIHDLASTVIQHFHRAHSIPDELFLCSCFALLSAGSNNVLRLEAALRPIGFVRAIVTTLSALPDTALSLVWLCLTYLVEIAFQRPPRYPDIALALESGLLPVIINVGLSSTRAVEKKVKYGIQISTMIKDLLTVALPRATVHFIVVSQLKDSFPEAASLAIKSRFAKSVFTREWKSFSALVSARLELLDKWEEMSRESLKGCDNMECGKIEQNRDLRHCATCRTTNYCSKDCQLIDWRAGHKEECQELRTLRLIGWFVSTLLDHNYLRLMDGLCFHRVAYMHKHPDERFFTVFTYAAPDGVGVDFKPASAVEGRDWAAQLPAQFSRAARSSGRVDIHLVFIYEGERTRRILYLRERQC
ncbi:hypothetical protein C8R44DRAFT_738839 [Mycena epipterygia]|nr:hypothetical protein C8R44DRAFT_738839 [Mycena epipterygia]